MTDPGFQPSTSFEVGFSAPSPPHGDTVGTSPRGAASALPTLETWLRREAGSIADRWLAALKGQGAGARGEAGDLMERFTPFLTSFLSVSMGSFREPAEPLWKQAAELYGSVAGMRGLAAGEVVEEFQLLREVLLRRLWEATEAGELHVSLRDLLLLNRTVDLGVTHSSVGHTDALFFAMFHGAGVPRTLTPEILEEVETQVAGLKGDLLRLERP